MRGQMGKPIPSPVVLGQITERFREAVKSLAQRQQIPVHEFTHKEKKDGSVAESVGEYVLPWVRGNDALWKRWKANCRLSTVPTNAWKSQQRRFPHSHGEPAVTPQTKRKPKSKILWDRGKVEIQKPDFHFPTVPVCLRRKEERREGGSSSHQQE